ncbi:MAG TPA: TolC family protein [Bacteroidales bacterium]|nr:TolC family protein [Bacteroidales bacterium]
MYKTGFLILCLSLFGIIADCQTRSLDFYLNEGINNSPLLNEYRNQAGAAVDDSLLVRAAKKPFMEANSSLQYFPYSHNFGYDDVITDGGNYTAVVGISQNILNRGETSNKLNAATLQKRLANNSTKVTKDELVKSITDQYLAAWAGYSDLIFNRNFLQLMKKENDIVQNFVKSGVSNQTDYLTLLIETQSQELLVSQLSTQYRKDFMLLNLLCGIGDTTLYAVEKPDLLPEGTADISKLPSFIRYKIDSMQIRNERRSIDLRYKPKISWFADAGFLTSTPWNFYRHFGYSAGVSLSVPIYDGHQRDIEKHKLEFSENSRKMYEENFRKQYYIQLRQYSDELESLDSMSVKLEEQVNNSGHLVDALRDQLEAGNIRMTVYINAIKNYKTINRNINLINIRKLQIINEMNFLLIQ